MVEIKCTIISNCPRFRTHTTAVSARMLYALAQDFKKDGVFRPHKYFSIDRVFRNETLDATHLAEFHQVFASFFLGFKRESFNIYLYDRSKAWLPIAI
jgi:hypothetical protein